MTTGLSGVRDYRTGKRYLPDLAGSTPAAATAHPERKENIMIHAREDYNRIQDPAGKIPEDEPVFLIRAQDQVSASTVRAWAELNKVAGGDPLLTQMAYDHAETIESWQDSHGKKAADL